jgi:hypothetical protein
VKTTVSKKGQQILINGRPVYSEIPGANPKALGLLWNQRLIQGVFDDFKDRSRFNQFKTGLFDPQANTDALVAALPAWHAYGLRGLTVSFQGGCPVQCVDVGDIDNNPFGSDGLTLDPAYAARMDSIIRAADEIGMIVIVSLLYAAQTRFFKSGQAVINAVKTGASFLRHGQYTNVILEVVNEYNIEPFAIHPIVHEPEGMAFLIGLAREYSGGMLVGSSGGGGLVDEEVIRASDIAIIHANGLSRGDYYDLVEKVKVWSPDSPILCNEDSPCCSRVDVALDTGTSWGYFNNYTKQIPPADYGVTPGEDLFFARRVARAVGIPVEELPFEDQFYLQGLEEFTSFGGKRVIRLAAEFPEKIVKVAFYQNDQLVYISYDEPFYCWRITTFLGRTWTIDPVIRQWRAVIYLADGTCLEKTADL